MVTPLQFWPLLPPSSVWNRRLIIFLLSFLHLFCSFVCIPKKLFGKSLPCCVCYLLGLTCLPYWTAKIHLYHWVAVLCIHSTMCNVVVPHENCSFLHPLSHWRAPGLFPGFCSSEQCYDQLIYMLPDVCAWDFPGWLHKGQSPRLQVYSVWGDKAGPLFQSVVSTSTSNGYEFLWPTSSSALGSGRCFNFCCLDWNGISLLWSLMMRRSCSYLLDSSSVRCPFILVFWRAMCSFLTYLQEFFVCSWS